MNRPTDAAPVSYVLGGPAARWVRVLADFGHLSPEALDRLYVGVADLAAAEGLRPDRPVDLALVRRAAALVLDAGQLGPGGEPGLSPQLEEDWAILFS